MKEECAASTDYFCIACTPLASPALDEGWSVSSTWLLWVCLALQWLTVEKGKHSFHKLVPQIRFGLENFPVHGQLWGGQKGKSRTQLPRPWTT